MFTNEGTNMPVTVIEAGPCSVIQVKTREKDGVNAVQIGFGKKKKPSKAAMGHQKGQSFQYLREFRVDDVSKYQVGQVISVKDFSSGEYVDATGIMKGRGFAGAVKRHGFHGAPASHGHDHPRAVGSIGGRFPQHTLKGTRMAGRMGGNGVTVKNLFIVDVNSDKNLIAVSGAVPGSKNTLIKLKTTGKTVKHAFQVFEPGKEVEKQDAKLQEPAADAAPAEGEAK